MFIGTGIIWCGSRVRLKEERCTVECDNCGGCCDDCCDWDEILEPVDCSAVTNCALKIAKGGKCPGPVVSAAAGD